MRHRTLRICGSVSVQPLLSARPVVWPSPTHLSQYLLRLGVDNSKVRPGLVCADWRVAARYDVNR